MGTSLSCAASATGGPAQWYYFLHNDPQGQLSDGWYSYDANLTQTVEQLYQQNQAAVASRANRHLVPFTASSGYQYELDFQKMTQRNTQSGRERPIERTTDGLPPSSTAQAGPTAPKRARRSRKSSRSSGSTITYTAPEKLHEVRVDESKVFVDVDPPKGKPKARKKDEKKQNSTEDEEDDCALCLDILWNKSGCRVVALTGCKHKYHYTCIQECLVKAGAKCPLCSKAIPQEQGSQTPKGKCCSGTMTVSTDDHTHCESYEDVGTITISYQLHGGVQKEYHQNPGHAFSGASRTAYLPDNQEGKDLLERLKYSFLHGLNFMVGTSLTTAQPNVVTWASIHHKTSSYGGFSAFGFPDTTYFERCNDEMDSLSVPNVAQCRKWLEENA